MAAGFRLGRGVTAGRDVTVDLGVLEVREVAVDRGADDACVVLIGAAGDPAG